MPPATATPQTPASPEQALSDLLTLDELTELISLISTITDSMHAQLSDAFDNAVSVEKKPMTHPHARLQKNDRNPNLASADHEEADADGFRKREREAQARRERELPKSGLGQLKSDALEWFQAWRDGYVGMVVDALNATDLDVNQNEVTGAKVEAAAPPNDEVLGES